MQRSPETGKGHSDSLVRNSHGVPDDDQRLLIDLISSVAPDSDRLNNTFGSESSTCHISTMEDAVDAWKEVSAETFRIGQTVISTLSNIRPAASKSSGTLGNKRRIRRSEADNNGQRTAPTISEHPMKLPFFLEDTGDEESTISTLPAATNKRRRLPSERSKDDDTSTARNTFIERSDCSPCEIETSRLDAKLEHIAALHRELLEQMMNMIDLPIVSETSRSQDSTIVKH